MKTNLIQTFIHTNNSPKKKKEVPDFDIEQELANKTFIRPLQGQGRLVKGNILDAPIEMAKGITYDIRALKNSANGDANDHQLGKLNDLGMKIGGLSIAGYLLTKRTTPLTKTMEFVGLGSFFASMALWPKIAIQIPARLIHGFNVQQKYEDSFGRKKSFYQDPQFIPWDLYSDDEINKIGNRMGIPQNIPNRRDFIQEKMKKIAIQNNTLWMLTAGFATPIMSALICNSLEKPLSKPLSNLRNKSNNNILNNFQQVNGFKDNNIPKAVEEIISINQNKPLSDKLIYSLAKALTSGLDPRCCDALRKDLNSILLKNSSIINDNTISTLYNSTKAELMNKKLSEQVIDSILPNTTKLKEYFAKDNQYFGREINKDEAERIFTQFTKLIRKNIDEYNKNNPQNQLNSKDKKTIIHTLMAPAKNNPIYQSLHQERYSILDDKNQKIIRQYSEAFSSLKTETNKIDTYIYKKLGLAPETTLADFWNNTIDILIKELKLSSGQLSKIRSDRYLATDVLRTRFDSIAADKNTYKQVMTSLVNQIAELDRLIKQNDIETKLGKITDKTLEDFAKKITTIAEGNNQNSEFLLNYILGSRPNTDSERLTKGSLKELYKTMTKDRLLSVKASLFRILNTFDTYRRIAIGDKSNLNALSPLCRELKEEVVELAKWCGLGAHSSDYLTKFFHKYNPHPNLEDMSDIQIADGRPKYKYYGQTSNLEKTAMPDDTRLFKGTMNLMYSDALSQETEQIFGNKYQALLTEFKAHRNSMLRTFGTAEYLENIHNKVAIESLASTPKGMFNLLGAATDKIIENCAQQSHNTLKWRNIFIPAGATLLGITVLAQFFFGKMKAPEPFNENQKER